MKLPRLPALRRATSAGLALLLAAGSAGAQALPDGEPAPPKVHPVAWALTAAGRDTELLVVLGEQADVSHAESLRDRDERRFFVWSVLLATSDRSQAGLKAFLATRGRPARSFISVNALWTKGDRELVRQLAARPEVARVDPNPKVRVVAPELSGGTGGGTLAVEWGVDRTNAPLAWPEGNGQGIVVGGQDTGVRWTHQVIKNQYRGWDGATASHDYNWHDAIHGAGAGNPCGSDSPVPCDDNGHGTHTVGTTVGDDGLGNQVGVAPGARWIGCRNMDSGWGTPATYLECFDFWLAPWPIGGDPSLGDPAKGPDVTINSWACPPAEGCVWFTFELALAAQRAAGIMTVVAAGNEGPSCGSCGSPPGLSDEAYTVGATDSSDGLAGFSSRGPGFGTSAGKPDIVAPGVGVRSATAAGDDTFGSWSGTSMATPHVSGCVAVLWSARPTYRNRMRETEDLFNRTARRLPAIVEACGGDYVEGPNNSWGHGLIDLARAVAEACQAAETACADAFDGDCDGLEDCADPDCAGDAACPEAGNCTDAVDNDLDLRADCADPDCDGDAACPEALACDDGRDNDLDGPSDCADVDCAGDPACPEAGNCADAVDNDLDGPVDCGDVDCAGDPACPEAGNCTDAVDNDLDGFADCGDVDCAGDPACPEPGHCADGVDNDLDGPADCADPDCDGDAACPEAVSCADGRDNDFDHLADCADWDCAGDPACPESGHCADAVDNDSDGRVDCWDPDCAGDPSCPEQGSCGDGVDNDQDGAADCADPDCDGDGACPEILSCADGRDNDVDGVTDCADADCSGDPSCPESGHCADAVDNDRDGSVDCGDPECLGDPACARADLDGDGSANEDDCLPADAGAFAVPPEIRDLRLVRGRQPLGAILRWTPVSAVSGTGTTHELATGTLSSLRALGFAQGSCEPTAGGMVDTRSPGSEGLFYLVRAINACGPPAGANWGVDSMDRRRPGCP